MLTSTLTAKNQTTIPKAILKALGARPSCKLCYDIEQGGRVLLTAKSATFAELAGSFPAKKRRKAASLDEMQAAIISGAAKRLRRRK